MKPGFEVTQDVAREVTNGLRFLPEQREEIRNRRRAMSLDAARESLRFRADATAVIDDLKDALHELLERGASARHGCAGQRGGHHGRDAINGRLKPLRAPPRGFEPFFAAQRQYDVGK
ncbi:hypothetical protein BHS09_31490 [Myxococcus xanthus]|uniref:Uncharacterized protein n=2 Tax=Myxococcaceae TaxID=31 RepID=A0AAE6G533_MYXXA|nr:hypothetical protein BHS09_31490 [Myxococcus xanthus]QDE78415.1 hypothetical protein BHS08_31510 [Myxococcus xanthus]QDF07713.1 hypothetical protein BHS04_31610 [Myxococcus xanthus]